MTVVLDWFAAIFFANEQTGERGAKEPEFLLRPHLPCPQILLHNQIWGETSFLVCRRKEKIPEISWEKQKLLDFLLISYY